MRSWRKHAFHSNLAFCVLEHVYEPAEDSFLMADNLLINEGETVLDMGTGCGILAILAARKARKVVAVDINPHAVICAKLNVRIHDFRDKIDVRLGDLFQPIKKKERFDLIVFNAPYLPSSSNDRKSWLDRAWDGGPTGLQLINRFLSEMSQHLEKDGRVLLVQSSLSDLNETMGRLGKLGLRSEIIAERKVAFETIFVIQAGSPASRRRDSCDEDQLPAASCAKEPCESIGFKG